MMLSVVMIAFNEEGNIGETLTSLYNQTLPPEEVVVVDNGSTDETALKALQYGAKVVYEPVKVRGKAWNSGIEASKGEFIAFCGADFTLHPEWLERLVNHVAYDNVGGVAGLIKAKNHKKLIPRLIDLSPYRVGNSVMMYRREALDKVGGFNPLLHNAEDTDLAHRVMKAGYKIAFHPKILAFHDYPDTWKGFVKRQFTYGVWSVRRSFSKSDIPLMFLFPFLFLKHLFKIRKHPVLPFFLTVSSFAYFLGKWKALL